MILVVLFGILLLIFLMLYFASDTPIYIFAFMFCAVFFLTALSKLVLARQDNDYMKTRYEKIMRVKESYDETETPYDMTLINEIYEWNEDYRKYLDGMKEFTLRDFYPAETINGTSEIELEIPR